MLILPCCSGRCRFLPAVAGRLLTHCAATFSCIILGHHTCSSPFLYTAWTPRDSYAVVVVPSAPVHVQTGTDYLTAPSGLPHARSWLVWQQFACGFWIWLRLHYYRRLVWVALHFAAAMRGYTYCRHGWLPGFFCSRLRCRFFWINGLHMRFAALLHGFQCWVSLIPAAYAVL